MAQVKVFNGLDKVMKDGVLVLTLKDQDNIADGAINEDAGTLEKNGSV